MATTIFNINEIKEGMEITMFVGYNMANNGIGKARIHKIEGGRVLNSWCGDDGEYDNPWWTTLEDLSGDLNYLKYVLDYDASHK